MGNTVHLSCGRNQRDAETAQQPHQDENPSHSAPSLPVDLIKQYFFEGHTYNVILDLLSTVHGIQYNLRTLKNRLKHLGLS